MQGKHFTGANRIEYPVRNLNPELDNTFGLWVSPQGRAVDQAEYVELLFIVGFDIGLHLRALKT